MDSTQAFELLQKSIRIKQDEYKEYYNNYSLSHDYSNPLPIDKWINAGCPKD